MIPSGLYRENVVIDKPLELVGDGSDGTVELWPAKGPGIEVRADQVLIRNIKLHGRSASPVIQARFASVVLEDSEITGGTFTVKVDGEGVECTIRRCRIFGGLVGIMLSASHVTIDDCTIGGHRSSGIDVGGEWVTSLSITRCHIDSNQGAGIDCSGDMRLSWGEISDCVLQGNFYGIRMSYSDAQTDLSYPSIERCQFIRNKHSGIDVSGKANPRLSDCEITGPGYIGVYIRDGAHPRVSNAMIGGAIDIGIRVDGMCQDAEGRGISGCIIQDTTIAGIEIMKGAKPYIDACEIKDNAGVGIDIRAGASPTVRSCQITGNRLAGIWARTDAGGEVCACTVEHNAGKSILVEEGSNTDIRIERNMVDQPAEDEDDD